MPSRFLVLFFFICVLLITFLGAPFSAGHLWTLLKANVALNGFILSVFGAGTLLVLSHSWQLWRSRRFFKAWAPVFEEEFLSAAPHWLHTRLSELPDRRTWSITENSIATFFDAYRSLLAYIMSALVFLGLLGTFWGLSLTVKGVVNILHETAPAQASLSWIALKTQLLGPLSGVQVAFSTSLFGMTGSLILGACDVILKKSQADFWQLWDVWGTHLKKQWVLTQAEAPTSDQDLSALTSFWTEATLSLDQLARHLKTLQQEQGDLRTTLHTLSGKIGHLVHRLEETQNENTQRTQGITRVADELCKLSKLYQGQGVHFETFLTRFLETMMKNLETQLVAMQREVRGLARTLSHASGDTAEQKARTQRKSTLSYKPHSKKQEQNTE